MHRTQHITMGQNFKNNPCSIATNGCITICSKYDFYKVCIFIMGSIYYLSLSCSLLFFCIAYIFFSLIYLVYRTVLCFSLSLSVSHSLFPSLSFPLSVSVSLLSCLLSYFIHPFRQPSDSDERAEALETGGLDLILVPGLAFSDKGER